MEFRVVVEALEAEAARAVGALGEAEEADFDRPTRCRPWSVRALLAHLLVASDRLPAMLAAPAPADADVSAGGYYRPDERFGPQANGTRVTTAASDAAALASGHDLVRAFDEACGQMVALARAESPGRLVRTRWGDAMTLSDFLVTRVAEVGVHGLDLADGLGCRAWLTPAAAGVIEWLVVGETAIGEVPGLEWDQLTLIEVATGRRPVSDDEGALLARCGVRWLTFG